MTYTASVTSQGQVSIPAELWKKYNLKGKTVVWEDLEGEIKIRPVRDLLEMGGIFKTDKKISFKKTRRAFEHYLATRHLGNKLI